MTRIGLESKDRPVEMNSINRCTADTCWQITSGSNGSVAGLRDEAKNDRLTAESRRRFQCLA